jgi:hypothetical protein
MNLSIQFLSHIFFQETFIKFPLRVGTVLDNRDGSVKRNSFHRLGAYNTAQS